MSWSDEHGQEALELVEALQPDLVLTDIDMPLMDGVELTRLLRERWREMPVIVVSGSAYEERALEARQAGAVDYVRKGRVEAELLELVLAVASKLPKLAG